MRQPRSPRSAYDRAGNELEPITLWNMRYHGVRSVDPTCNDCQHEARVLVGMLSDHVLVPDVALILKRSVCGSKNVTTRPDWREHREWGRGC